MTKDEQIQEMAKIIGKPCYTIMNEAGIEGKECTLPYECHECSARRLYAKDYRKVERGEWIRQEKEIGKVTPEAVCSKCGRDVVYQVVDNKWEFENFCPRCGADMRGNPDGQS